MEMNEASRDIFYVVYIHQFQPEPTHKIHLAAAEAPSLKISSHGTSHAHEDHPNQHENRHKLCYEMGHPVVN